MKRLHQLLNAMVKADWFLIIVVKKPYGLIDVYKRQIDFLLTMLYPLRCGKRTNHSSIILASVKI